MLIASTLASCGNIEGGRICRFGKNVLYRPTTGQELPSGLPETHGVVFVRVEGNTFTGRDRQGPFPPKEFDVGRPAGIKIETPSGVEIFTATKTALYNVVEVDYRCTAKERGR